MRSCFIRVIISPVSSFASRRAQFAFLLFKARETKFDLRQQLFVLLIRRFLNCLACFAKVLWSLIRKFNQAGSIAHVNLCWILGCITLRLSVCALLSITRYKRTRIPLSDNIVNNWLPAYYHLDFDFRVYRRSSIYMNWECPFPNPILTAKDV